ncbi:transposase [Paenibacillus sp. NPDC058174]|uniref:transposase n=1 Tax=Paenibacillus sp. NPDC058174 TaxID=3346366 RepID=UPI0036D9C2D7
MLGIAESTYYDRKKREASKADPSEKSQSTTTVRRGRSNTEYSLTKEGRKISNEQIKGWLLELVEGEGREYGYKRLMLCLRDRHQLVLGKKKAYRLCKELQILRVQRAVKTK